jgi:hypothetical protein
MVEERSRRGPHVRLRLPSPKPNAAQLTAYAFPHGARRTYLFGSNAAPQNAASSAATSSPWSASEKQGRPPASCLETTANA